MFLTRLYLLKHFNWINNVLGNFSIKSKSYHLLMVLFLCISHCLMSRWPPWAPPLRFCWAASPSAGGGGEGNAPIAPSARSLFLSERSEPLTVAGAWPVHDARMPWASPSTQLRTFTKPSDSSLESCWTTGLRVHSLTLFCHQLRKH